MSRGESAQPDGTEEHMRHCSQLARTNTFLLSGVVIVYNTSAYKKGSVDLGYHTRCHTRYISLYPQQGDHLDKLPVVLDGRQQPSLTVKLKAAESVAEDLPLDWVRVDLQRLALQGQHEYAPAT